MAAVQLLKDVPETFGAVVGFVSLLKGKKRPTGITLYLQLEQNGNFT